MTKDQQLLEMLAALGVSVEYAQPAHGRDGEYFHDRKLIRLRPKMSERLHRSVLAHETAHAVFGDVPTLFGPVNAKQERRADEWAAMRLIDLRQYQRAEHLHDGHAGAIAQELGVVRSIAEAYARVLLRIGDFTYVDAKMGAGQYVHREQVAS